MAQRQPVAGHSWFKAIAWLLASLVGILLVGAVSVVVGGWLLDGVESMNGDRQDAAERSALGDYFGGVSAVFSGLALLLLVVPLLFQQRELQLQRQELAAQRSELAASRDELRRSAAADLRALHVQLTQMQLDDPVLAEVWNDYAGEPPEVVRQNLFANLTYSHFLLASQWGEYSDEELLTHARGLVRSPVFRRYWAASRERKALLSPDSHEARMFRIFDRAVSEAAPDGQRPASPPA
ncbi:DUF6082 family protein [Streptomyces sp. Da 82-17]|uniref:DUF6082 family protein n=1 Tax=Streptomyces sp. Da 82-17 TaxID=3377116 RepID=UPI0038D45769